MYPLPQEEDNCRELVEVTENEIEDSVHSVPKLDTLILVKSMIKNRSFSNPFSLAAKERYQKNGRANSAPEAYDIYEK
jgi:[calcium/calmodulin-dependent protein kinase] kinase